MKRRIFAHTRFMTFYFLVALTLSGCLNSELTQYLGDGGDDPDAQVAEGEFFEGLVPLVGGESLDLSSVMDEKVLLIFSAEFCDACREETQAIKDRFADFSDFRVLTVLVSTFEKDAEFWASFENWDDEQEVPWDVAFEEETDLLDEYCPNTSPPCTLLSVPGEGIIFKKSGKLELDEILEF